MTLDWGSRSGWMVTLKGKSSWYRYIHMDGRDGAKSAIAKGLKDGSRVKAGQIISYVGDTGDASGGPCHLHFIIRPTRISSSDGTKLSRAGTIALRASPTLFPAAAVGRTVTITTTATQMTTALQDIVPLAWTAATVS